MALPLILQDIDKIFKERILLGNVTIDVTDCLGQTYTVHGIVANDLVVRNIDGTTTPLVTYIHSGGQAGDIGDSVVTRTDGTTITLREMADNIVPLNAISDAEAQADLDNIVI
jgi:hypothetical protein